VARLNLLNPRAQKISEWNHPVCDTTALPGDSVLVVDDSVSKSVWATFGHGLPSPAGGLVQGGNVRTGSGKYCLRHCPATAFFPGKTGKLFEPLL
jgi:hypothetical protein